jgi:hypothetical protein
MLHILELEINSNGVEKVFIERVFCVSEKQTALAHATVSDD